MANAPVLKSEQKGGELRRLVAKPAPLLHFTITHNLVSRAG